MKPGSIFIDTADVYSRSESEEIVGRAIKDNRDDVVLATKSFNPMGSERNHRGGSRRWIMRGAEDSLRRLGTDHIDLYQVHRLDWHTDVDETLGALTDLVRDGKVRYLGSSTFPAEWIVEAQWAAKERGRQRFVCEQPQYSIFARSAERAVLPTCSRHDMGVIPWSPLAGGWLTGKYRRGAEDPQCSPESALGRDHDIANDPRLDLVEELVSVADSVGLSITQLGLGFVDQHPAVTSVIIGPKTMAQLDDLLGATGGVLDADTLDAIDTIVAPGTDAPDIEQFVNNPALKPKGRRRVVHRVVAPWMNRRTAFRRRASRSPNASFSQCCHRSPNAVSAIGRS